MLRWMLRCTLRCMLRCMQRWKLAMYVAIAAAMHAATACCRDVSRTKWLIASTLQPMLAFVNFTQPPSTTWTCRLATMVVWAQNCTCVNVSHAAVSNIMVGRTQQTLGGLYPTKGVSTMRAFDATRRVANVGDVETSVHTGAAGTHHTTAATNATMSRRCGTNGQVHGRQARHGRAIAALQPSSSAAAAVQ